MTSPAPSTASSSLHLFQDKCLGQGTLGVTYRASCRGRGCAAKVMHSLSPRQPNTQNGVTDSGQNGTEPGPEHQRLISLSHRGLVQYYDFTHDPSSRLPVLLMEQMTESLTRFLERLKEPPPLHVQLDFAHDISLALAYLHQNSIIHGNLTSNNVLLSSDGHVKVSDYGLRSLLPITQAHSMGPCTIPFLPPEAFTVPPVYTDKLDSFSWGVVALQIMTCLFPNPSPTAQFVTDPRFPSKPIEVFVSEIGRRKSHIDRVGYTNPLLPVAVLCFENPGEKRPQMAEICQNVSLLKTSDDYRLSQEKTGIDWSARQITALSASRGNEEAVGHDYEEVDSSEQDGKLAAPAWQGSEEEVERLKQLSLSEGKRKGEGRGGGEMVEKGEGMGQAEGGGEGGGGGGGGGVGEGEGGGGGGGEGEGGKPREVEGGEGEEEQPIEPSAPPLQNGGLPPAASAPTTQPMLPPYTQASPWQHLPPPQQQLPPPYSETPPQYFQGPPQFQHHQPTPFPPQQNSGPPVGVGVQASTRQVQCDVCKRQMKYTLSPAKRVTVVKCSNCKEVTPVAPPPEGKVYDRCRFCNNCNVHPITAKRVVCPRQTCKKVLLFESKTGRMVRRLPCEVCQYEMQFYDDPNSTARTLICSRCGEATPIKSAPPGKAFSRCPYCNCCIIHNSASARVVCPRKTCQKTVEVGTGEKLSVQCQICQQHVIFYGKKSTVMCGHCGECTPVGAPPAGKAFLRCSCNALLIHDKSAGRVKCPRRTCGKVVQVGRSTATLVDTLADILW